MVCASSTRRGRMKLPAHLLPFHCIFLPDMGSHLIRQIELHLRHTDELAGQDTSGNALTVMVDVQVFVQLVAGLV